MLIDYIGEVVNGSYKKAQLSLTNPRDAKACQKYDNAGLSSFV